MKNSWILCNISQNNVMRYDSKNISTGQPILSAIKMIDNCLVSSLDNVLFWTYKSKIGLPSLGESWDP